MTKAEQEAYNRRLKIQRDNYAADKYARETAIAQGRAKGEAAKAEAIAKKLLAMGLTLAQVAESTGLSMEEIEALK